MNTLTNILIGDRATQSDFIFHFRVEYSTDFRLFKRKLKLHQVMIAWNNKAVIMWEHNKYQSLKRGKKAEGNSYPATKEILKTV